MNSFDEDIRRAVRDEAADASLATAGDEGLIAQVTATFRGRMRFWVGLTWLMSAAWAAVVVWAAVAFFRATTTRDWIMYATLFLWGLIAVGLLKMWNWMEANRYTHTREIKRLELQIARLIERIDRQ
jgi:FtsH-binding integral membrane protein